jgi:hypothetical protein
LQNLESLSEQLKAADSAIIYEIESNDYTKFGWILDYKQNKIEFWEPITKAFFLISFDNQ